ncbi:MAG: suppressor of fused domain protein [Clostridiales bacterium]|nr:suppressor of fused domain protein [Clostridiales bacterium]
MNLWNKIKNLWKGKKKKNQIQSTEEIAEEKSELAKEEETVENECSQKRVMIRKEIHVACPTMSKREYKKKMKEDANWMPGLEALDEELGQLYEDQKPERLDRAMLSKVNRGSGKQLDGYCFYTSINGYKHLISYGMSELYAKEEAYGQEKSKWGYEMTMKLAQERTMDAMWATNIMANLARYTFTSEECLSNGMLISGDGTPLKPHTNSKITALLVTEDEELPLLPTLNGTVQFLQLVGITQEENEWLKAHPDQIEQFIAAMKEENPMLVTDLNREENCKIITEEDGITDLKDECVSTVEE